MMLIQLVDQKHYEPIEDKQTYKPLQYSFKQRQWAAGTRLVTVGPDSAAVTVYCNSHIDRNASSRATLCPSRLMRSSTKHIRTYKPFGSLNSSNCAAFSEYSAVRLFPRALQSAPADAVSVGCARLVSPTVSAASKQ